MTSVDNAAAATEYRAARHRMVGLAAALGAVDAERVVGACPAWTVKDLFSHVTGIAVDLAAGNRPQGDPQVWVDRQVAERSPRSLAEVVDEWRAAGPAFEAMIEARPDRLWGLTYDLVVHEHDLRNAIGDRSGRDTSGVALAARLGLRLVAMDLAARGLPGVRVVIDGEEHLVGDGAPAVTLNATPFEALRILGSRRTVAEIRDARFEGDLDAVVGGLLHMDPPVASLGE